MDKRIAGLLGAVSALVVVDGASAATELTPVLQSPQTYADLLQPIPNAVALLVTSDAEGPRAAAADKGVEVADHHHHHHHHRRHYHHHHHHHHHHG